MEPNQTSNKTSMAIPAAIILGFAMIAIAIFFTTSRTSDDKDQQQNNQVNSTVSDGNPRPVDGSDYIRGNPNAPILMIEYSDYDCPFCKQYHTTMNQIMDEYGVTGRVAWVYRQLPLAQLHPNSPKVSEAALCVGDIGGTDAFWKFSDLIFEERELEEQTNVAQIPDYAEEAGVERDTYIECMESGRMKEAVKASVEDAFSIGAQGTPYTVLVVGNQQAVINGAQPYETVKGIVQNLIDQLDGNFDPASYSAETIPN